MLTIEYHSQFKKDYKLAQKRGYDVSKLEEIVVLLAKGEKLPERNHDHALYDTRIFKGVRECHIEPDWLLIYRVLEDKLILELMRTGTHSDLFA